MISGGHEYVLRMGRTIRAGGSTGGPLTRLITLVLMLVLAAVFLVLLVPLVLLGVVAAGGLFAYRKVRGLLSAAQSPNGVLDGRRNVRVIDRTER